MPQVTVYVREEDLPKWKAIEKKSEWLHKHLGGDTVIGQAATASISNFTGTSRPATKAETDRFLPKPPDPETGYPCCQKKTPCKHWQWSSEKSAYVNSLTGAEREPDL